MEITSSCSNPFLQIWGGERTASIKPVFDSKDDLAILAGVADAMAELTGEQRFRDMFKFELEGKRGSLHPAASGHLHDHRRLQTRRDHDRQVRAARRGLDAVYRTYPRIPFWEQIHDDNRSTPTRGGCTPTPMCPRRSSTARTSSSIAKGPEATQLPAQRDHQLRTRMFSPDDYGIPLDAEHWDERTVRNIKMPWERGQGTPRTSSGRTVFSFFLMTPKTSPSRALAHGVTVDWHLMHDSNFGDPLSYRQTHRLGLASINCTSTRRRPRDLGINDGDYVYVDANPADRPYRGWKEDDPFYKVAPLHVAGDVQSPPTPTTS